jgi:DNA-binding HxlR family transcriptional regulator
MPAIVLTEGLRQLLERGWAEQRHSDADTGEREWRLTDSGRNAR